MWMTIVLLSIAWLIVFGRMHKKKSSTCFINATKCPFYDLPHTTLNEWAKASPGGRLEVGSEAWDALMEEWKNHEVCFYA
jgi:hypothetical protein